jgi:hypothetical protein
MSMSVSVSVSVSAALSKSRSRIKLKTELTVCCYPGSFSRDLFQEVCEEGGVMSMTNLETRVFHLFPIIQGS